MNARLREATREDLKKFFDKPTPTLRAWVGEKDGEILGMGGYAFQEGRWVAFLDVRPEGREYKRMLVRAARNVVEAADRQGIRYLYAQADKREPMAAKWLKRLGFVETGGVFRRFNG